MTKPSKQEAVAEMIYEVCPVGDWKWNNDPREWQPPWIKKTYRRLAQKILNYLEGL